MFRQPAASVQMPASLDGWSIEVMPRTAAKIDDFRALLPQGTRVYVAHIDGTPFADMLETVQRLRAEGFPVMPHIPARIIADEAVLVDWLQAYRDAGVDQALVLAGGVARPAGAFDSSMALLKTGHFARLGFTRLHVAGHPEGNRDIDSDGSNTAVDAALRWKQDFARETGIDMAIATQFVFQAGPVTDWIARLRRNGIDLPVHVGIAGPAKLQTLLKFAIACGVGPSLGVLQKRARDVTKLLLPFEPGDVLGEFAAVEARTPELAPQAVHFFPLGGITACAEWIQRHGAGRLRSVAG